jgi:hypothetical protein
MLLYVVESGVPLLTGLLFYAGWMAYKKDIARHKKWAAIHAVLTWVSTALVAALVALGFKMGEGAPEWIMDIHLVFIYAIAPMLAVLMFTGLKGVRKIHIPLAMVYVLNWLASLFTGAMIFAADRGWLNLA